MSAALFEETEDFLADLIQQLCNRERLLETFQQVIESDLSFPFHDWKEPTLPPKVNKRNSYVFIQNSMNFQQACKTRLLLDVKEWEWSRKYKDD